MATNWLQQNQNDPSQSVGQLPEWLKAYIAQNITPLSADGPAAPVGAPAPAPQAQQAPAVPPPDHLPNVPLSAPGDQSTVALMGNGPANAPAPSAAPTPTPVPSPAPANASPAPASSVSPILSYEDWKKQNGNIPIAGRPQGPFDKIPDGQPGADSWRNKHNTLRETLALLAAGAAEFGGRDPWGTNGRPGEGMAVIQPWLQSENAKREYDANAPAAQEQANQTTYQKYVQEAHTAAQVAQMGQMVTLPNGVTMPYGIAIKTYPAYFTSQAAEHKAGYTGQTDGNNQPIAISGANLSEASKAALLEKGLESTPDGKGVQPIQDRSKLPLPLQSKLSMDDASKELRQAQTEYEKYKKDPNSWMAQMAKARFDLAKASFGMRQNDYMINNYGHDIDGNVPAGIEVGPDGQPIGAKFQRNFTPTMPTRTAAEYANSLQEHLPQFEKLITKLDKEGKLGPLSGRWEDFMAGKVGEGDPEYAQLRTFSQLFDTGLMKAHFGGKGAVQAMEHFMEMVNAGKMDGPTLIGSLKGIQPYLDTYTKMGTVHTSAGPNIKSGETPTPQKPKAVVDWNSLPRAD
jgi:hypothetical protein